MTITTGQLSEQLELSAVLAPDVIATVRDQSGLIDDDASGESLAKLLVKAGHLTKFQARLAFGGKAKHLVLGSYIVLDKIGEGGMGQVYKAQHKRMKREVALKILAPQFVKDQGALQRFHREVEAAARLTHPNIVTAYDADEIRGTHYLVMEYVRGEDLSQIVKQSGPLPVAKAVNCVLQAAVGLAYAHSQGVVHRDIKPSNLLLDESGTVKILDMGLARFDEPTNGAEQAALTGTGVLMGTIDYMSPEQAIDSKTADHRSDIYSLGCTLHLLITGKPVYEGDTIMKRVMAHQNEAIPQLPIEDESLQQLFEKMVAKNSAERFQATDEVVVILDSWLREHRDQASLHAIAEEPLQPGGSSILGRSSPLSGSTESPKAQKETDTDSPTPSESVADAKDSKTGGQTKNPFELITEQEPILRSQRKAARKREKPQSTPEDQAVQPDESFFSNRKRLTIAGGGVAVVLVLGAMILLSSGKSEKNREDITKDDASAAVVDADSASPKKKIPTEQTTTPEIASVKMSDTATGSGLAINDKPSAMKIGETPALDLNLGSIESLKPGKDETLADASKPATEIAKVTTTPPDLSMPLETTPEDGSAFETTATNRSATNSKAGTLAPLELRTQPRRKGLTPFKNTLRTNAPLGEFAAVSRPAKVKGLLSWSIEPLLHRSGYRSIDVRSDGMIATGGHDCAVRLWTKDWQLIKVLPGHANSVCDVAFSPDGKTLASVSSGPRDMVAIWDVASGQLLKFHDVDDWQGCLAWLPDGSQLVHGSIQGVEIIEPFTGQKIVDDIDNDKSGSMAVSPGGDRLVAGSLIIDTKTLKLVKQLEGFTGGHVDWSGDGRWVAVSDSYRTGIFDTRAFQLRREFKVRGQVAFSPDSTKLFIGSSECLVVKTADWSVLHQLGNPGNMFDATWSRDGTEIFTPGNTLDVASGKFRSNSSYSSTAYVYIAVNDSGNKVATLKRGRLRLWNGENGQLEDEFAVPIRYSTQLIWQPGGNLLLQLIAENSDKTDRFVLIDTRSGKIVHQLEGHKGTIWRACWSPDGSHLVSVGEDGTCRIWDASTGQIINTFTHSDPLWWVQWAHDGSKIAAGSAFSEIIVWDAKDGNLLREFKTLSEPMRAPAHLPANDGPFSFHKETDQIFYMAGDRGFEMLNVKTGQVTELGQAQSGGGNRLTVGWSIDFSLMGIYAGYGEFHLHRAGEKKGIPIRFFQTPHWLSGGKRLLGGNNNSSYVTGYDLRKMRRMGVLLPELSDNAWAALSSDGHFAGSENIDEKIVLVALYQDGRLNTYSPSEFADIFKWNNDPEKVKFLR